VADEMDCAIARRSVRTMTKRPRRSWLVMGYLMAAATAVATGGFSPTPARAAGDSLAPVQGVSPGSAPVGSTPLGPVAAAQAVDLSFVLPPSSGSQLHSLLTNLYDPASSQYHHWLARGQFDQQFGPTPAAVAAVTSWLAGQGLTPRRATEFSIQVTAPAGKLSTLLATSLERYRTPTGSVGFVANRAPMLPQSVIGAGVSSILGLNTFASWSPAIVQPSRQVGHTTTVHPNSDGLTPCPAADTYASTNGWYTLDQLGAAYGFGSLTGAGQTGRSQTVAVYELAPVSASDLTAYKTCFGLTTPFSRVNVDGGGTVSSGGTTEADLDVEQIATQASASSIISYEGPNTGAGAYHTWSAIVAADAASVVSTSWGQCEPDAFANGSISAYGLLFQQAAAQGQTILAASGDSGSEGCYSTSQSTLLEADYPAADPWVTAVGGTSLLGPNNEVTWNTCQNEVDTTCAVTNGGVAAGGGGLSRYAAKPSWQAPGWQWSTAVNPCGLVCRQVPDISANAGVGEVIYVNGAWTAVGGTSAAAPLIAGLVADKNQACVAATGDFAPLLSALARQGAYGSALTDITSGDNDMTRTYAGAEFPASAGFDAATGLGSPLAAGLACPEVSSVAPTSAAPGTNVNVYGLGLEHASISFGGAAASVVSASATQATVVVPSGSGPVVVGGSSVLGTGTTTSPFSILAPPPPPFHPQGVGAPSVAIDPSGAQLIFWQGAGGHLMEAWWNGSWNGPVDWTAANHWAPSLTSAPSVALAPDGTQIIFWQGAGGHLYEAWWKGSWNGPVDWTAANHWPASVTSAPSVTFNAAGTQLIFWQAAGGHLDEVWWNGSWNGPVDWTAANHWPASVTSAPSVAIDPSGTQLIFWKGAGGHLDEVWWNGSWNGPVDWTAAKGWAPSLTSAPSVAFAPDGTQLIFWQGAGGHLFEVWWNGSWNGPVDWTAANRWPATMTSAPSVVFSGGTQLIFWQGAGGHLIEVWWNGSWNGPVDWSG
jgi:hypothetical protein